MSELPPASVIVLAHDKAAYTRLCVEGLCASSHRPLELVLVDNGSTDETPQLVDEFAARCTEADLGFEAIRNETNLGAPAGRNQAIERASGEILVFMDNDVTPRRRDWCETLSRTLIEDDMVAFAGPKLVFPFAPYPIEFAGAVVSPGGRVGYLGRGEPIDEPTHNGRRDVQCFISACIATRRAILDEIGGFDEAFSPAQFEDLDLCYRARDRGYRVVYVPEAELYHFEHVTTDGSADINFRYVTIKNGMLFKERWGHLFAKEGGPPDAEVTWHDLQRKRIDQIPPPPII